MIRFSSSGDTNYRDPVGTGFDKAFDYVLAMRRDEGLLIIGKRFADDLAHDSGLRWMEKRFQ